MKIEVLKILTQEAQMILLTGFSGNTGSLVLSNLLKKYDASEIIGLTRNDQINNEHNINLVYGELTDSETIERIFIEHNIQGIIHIANIRYSPLIMELASKYNVERVVLVHTTGVYSKYRSYSELYKDIESEIMNNTYAKTSYVIVRPTMIYGNELDHNMHKLIKFLDKLPFFPVFGDGSALMQPVHVEDLADGIVAAYEKNDIKNEDFDLSGGSVVEYKKVLKLITNKMEKKVFFIHIPLNIAILLTKIYNAVFRSKALVTTEQVERLQEDKAYPNVKAQEMIGFNPRSFEKGIVQEIELLKAKGLIK